MTSVTALGTPGVRPRLRGRRIPATVIGVPIIVMAVLATGLAASQNSSRNALQQRFAARGVVTADVLTSYVADLMSHEQRVAAATLAGAHPQRAFAKEVAAFGFQAAVLLDRHGRALGVVPSAPELIGTDLAARYPHLAAAEAGKPAVSPVVRSAGRGVAVVAFAVPFDTPFGRRVFSGAYASSQTRLTAFLGDALTTPQARLYVVDDGTRVVASNHSFDPSGDLLSELDPALHAAVRQRSSGFVDEGPSPYYFTMGRVPQTSWTLIVAVPKTYLFGAVDGASRWVPWVILAGLALFLGFTAWLTTRVLAQRQRLAEANERLERLARTDSLTGLFNRRYVNEQLALHCASSRRHDFSVAVLMVDVDYFKRLNDTFGHAAGDDALRHVADLVARSLRTEDLAGRWGGEEFVVVLPHTTLDEAMVVAERLRADIAAATVELGNGGDSVTLSVSIGVAAHQGELPDVLVHRADLALYDAKNSGRDRVCVAQRTSLRP
jgi:diguanylate cyclase (GGDEF)-like protein